MSEHGANLADQFLAGVGPFVEDATDPVIQALPIFAAEIAGGDDDDGHLPPGFVSAHLFEELEETAKLYLLLRGMNPGYLTPQQVADLVSFFGLILPRDD